MKLSSIDVNPSKEKQFNNSGIYSVEDLIKYTPRKYIDYRIAKDIISLKEGEFVAVIGTVLKVRDINSKMPCVIATIEDDKGDIIEAVWFHQSYVARILKTSEKYIFCGKCVMGKYPRRLQLSSPLFSADMRKYQRLMPIYKKIKGMSDDYLKEKILAALDIVKNKEYLEVDILKEYNLPRTFEMARCVHEPQKPEDIKTAEDRMIFDELFSMAFELCSDAYLKNTKSTIVCTEATYINKFLASLPFPLTDGEGGQLHAVREIYKKLRKGIKTSSLVQGDVGCGKTFIAMLISLIMAENGYQSVIMAPTNVLASQHFLEFQKRLAIFPDIKIAFINGNMKKKEKREAISQIASGEANIIIGTHALISEGVDFNKLGITIVDEEHRFGVAQRKLLQEKSDDNTHHMTMSATPIPRTLGLSLYGENTDIYTITKMPMGRKKVETSIEEDMSNAYKFMEDKIKLGQQAYIVCPLIDESESELFENVDSVNETFIEAEKYFKGKGVKIGVINGKMKQVEVNEEIKKFNDKLYDILISTTIVEVGVNVPNATVMVIKNSERFGLAQLHQLRGRVGRGDLQSYCILVSLKADRERLVLMTKTNDGFVIAEEDLKLRGMGDFVGTKQTGESKNIMIMLGNMKLYEKIKQTVFSILKDNKRYDYYKNILEVKREETL